jgi:hypothetical protein
MYTAFFRGGYLHAYQKPPPKSRLKFSIQIVFYNKPYVRLQLVVTTHTNKHMKNRLGYFICFRQGEICIMKKIQHCKKQH